MAETPLLSLREREKLLWNLTFPYCNKDVSSYERILKIGQGTFGEVFKARDRRSPTKYVAMKKVLMTNNENEGFPLTALREFKILQRLDHKNIVNLIEICYSTDSRNNYRPTFFFIFDFCEHDLAGLLSNTDVKFSLGDIKQVMKQLFEALFYVHNNRILHRDVKSANILITKDGCLKLADFGLARAINSTNGVPNRYTNRVVTLWYRPPELLLGERNYGPPIDVWGAGCIMAEMWTRRPILQGNTEQKLLELISNLCGSITPVVWPGVENLELYKKMELPKGQKRKVKERLKVCVKDAAGLDLLDKLLMLDPKQRINSDNALSHDFFWLDPLPSDLGKMLAQHTRSMFEYLAPQRRPVKRPHHHSLSVSSTKRVLMENGYQDRVF